MSGRAKVKGQVSRGQGGGGVKGSLSQEWGLVLEVCVCVRVSVFHSLRLIVFNILHFH